MRMISISKGNGKSRIIYDPNAQEREVLALHFDQLRTLQERILHDCVHGFRMKRSPITNALPHLNKDFTLSFDIASFFDSVDCLHLKDILPENMLRTVGSGGVLYMAAPRQGLSTSPFVANIAADRMDRDILSMLCKSMTPITYTRYADDLSFSWCVDRSLHDWLRKEVKSVIEGHRFSLARGKTHLQSARAGRRVICGVAVDHEIHARREARRRLRAATHRVINLAKTHNFANALNGKPMKIDIRLAHRQMVGLNAWCNMTIPQETKLGVKVSPSSMGVRSRRFP